MIKAKIYRRKVKGKYVSRMVNIPSSFPNVEEVIVLTPEEYREIFGVLKTIYLTVKDYFENSDRVTLSEVDGVTPCRTGKL